jgi:hypothetical protein
MIRVIMVIMVIRVIRILEIIVIIRVKRVIRGVTLNSDINGLMTRRLVNNEATFIMTHTVPGFHKATPDGKCT